MPGWRGVRPNSLGRPFGQHSIDVYRSIVYLTYTTATLQHKTTSATSCSVRSPLAFSSSAPFSYSPLLSLVVPVQLVKRDENRCSTRTVWYRVPGRDHRVRLSVCPSVCSFAGGFEEREGGGRRERHVSLTASSRRSRLLVESTREKGEEGKGGRQLALHV